MKLVTASANRTLDDILDLIGFYLQLTNTQFKKAKQTYESLGEYLLESESAVATYRPLVFHQGSMLFDTTTRPVKYTEYDLDLVLLLYLYHPSPLFVYNLVRKQLENSRYATRMTPMPRCFRLTYSGQFHLDVIPAIPKPGCPPGDTCLLIPDRDLRKWRDSNPLGLNVWLNHKASRLLKFAENRYIKPLRRPVPAYLKPPLKLAIQLLKRWRDVAFKGREELAPSSIILTVLAGHLYRGEDHPTDALLTILDGIHRWACSEPILFTNPSNPSEWITDKWKDKPEAYQVFIEEVFDFRVRWHKLVESGRVPTMIDDLKDMFEGFPVTKAYEMFAEGKRAARDEDRLFMEKATGNLLVAPSPGIMQGALKSKDHSFFGGTFYSPMDLGPKNILGIREQLARMRIHFPQMKSRNAGRLLVCEGTFSPTERSIPYRVRIEYQAGHAPEIQVLSPKLKIPEGEKLPHVYKGDALCLYFPGKLEWKGDMSLPHTIVPWIAEWLFFYEVWLQTGKWLGGGIDHVKVRTVRRGHE